MHNSLQIKIKTLISFLITSIVPTHNLCQALHTRVITLHSISLSLLLFTARSLFAQK